MRALERWLSGQHGISEADRLAIWTVVNLEYAPKRPLRRRARVCKIDFRDTIYHERAES